jgi:hypothetical protein
VADTITITVTQDDIDNGVRAAPCLCPIALAAQRKYPYVSVGTFTISVGADASREKVYRMPLKASRFIEDFDQGRLVEPFTFTARKCPAE